MKEPERHNNFDFTKYWSPETEADLRRYIAAYDLTYARNYEMEGDYIATRTDSDYFQFTAEQGPPRTLVETSTPEHFLHQLLGRENTEFVMLSIVD